VPAVPVREQHQPLACDVLDHHVVEERSTCTEVIVDVLRAHEVAVEVVLAHYHRLLRVGDVEDVDIGTLEASTITA
jgi:hypothetical protein